MLFLRVNAGLQQKKTGWHGGARATSSGQVGVYKNGSLLGTRDITAWPYYANSGYIGLWFNQAGNALLDDFGGGSMPGGSLLGMHVKASLVKVSHEKAYQKAQMMQAPPAGQVWKSYYFQGAARIAMRVQVNGVADQVYYLLADHLGSTTVSYRSDGQDTRFQSYKPWGEFRESGNSLPTDRTFTGQRWSASIGLSFFNARWFDSMLGRFISPDTLIPGAGNPQAWDRYAYSYGNPVKYTDPSGHVPCLEDGYCINESYSELDHLKYLSHQYGIRFSGTWSIANQRAVITGVQAVAFKLNSSSVDAAHPALAFRGVFGIQSKDKFNFEMGCSTCTAMGFTLGTRHIQFRQFYEEADYLGRTDEMALFMNTTLVVHELFHAFESAMEITLEDGTRYKEARSTLPGNFTREGLAEPFMVWQQSTDNGNGEIFADMGIGWVYGKWNSGNPILSVQMSDWIDDHMPHFTDVARNNQR